AADAFKELVDPDKTSWQLSATFQASDLGLRTRKNTNAILAARNSQAALDLQTAEQAVRTRLEGWHQDALQLAANLAARLADYEAASADLAEEETRAQQGSSNQDLLRRRRLSEYSAAFRLLSVLRDAELLVLQIQQAQ
ncbi:MAG: hypothetical protein KKC64_15680, partial [Spirochaetes bacterium]|nr:hypothetical protein [Spirochaetota bacterium]